MTNRKILIVDDNKLLLLVMERYLKRQGFSHVLAVSTGEDAVNAAMQIFFDLVILDINLPEMDGWHALDRIKSINHKTEVIMITGSSLEVDKYRTLSNGAFDLLMKPFTLEELNKVIECALRPCSVKRHENLRIACAIDVKLKCGDLEFTGITKDLSRTGMLLKINKYAYEYIRVGNKIEIEFLYENYILTLEGQIVRQELPEYSDQMCYIGVKLIDPLHFYRNFYCSKMESVG